MGIVAVLGSIGFLCAFVPIGLALTTTALGTLLPILRDTDMLHGSAAWAARGGSRARCLRVDARGRSISASSRRGPRGHGGIRMMQGKAAACMPFRAVRWRLMSVFPEAPR